MRVLARMEHLGVGVDGGRPCGRSTPRSPSVASHRTGRRRSPPAMSEFNVNSTPQLRRVVAGTVGNRPHPAEGKTATGYSTDQATLEKLQGEHPIIRPLLRHREVEKLRSTGERACLAEVAADGRTQRHVQSRPSPGPGRLSSDAPQPAQHHPVRSEGGRRFREGERARGGREAALSP